MKIKQVDQKEYLPEIINVIINLDRGSAIKITDYDKKSPLPQYLATYIRSGFLEKGSYATKKIDNQTYIVIKK